jgi:O-acetyl-ADP-ribose deacetylase (regulator of RNase III)
MAVQITVERTTLELIQGDITDMETDAIVNAANSHLAHGGGVAAAIARRGGAAVERESSAWIREHGRVDTGSAAITSGGELPAKYVIHAVGPVYDATDASRRQLAAAVRSSLKMADEHDLHSIALPAISTGIYGYPVRQAARVILSAAMDYLQGETALERVVFCLYDKNTRSVFEQTLKELCDEQT